MPNTYIKQITVNGTTHLIKDEEARQSIADLEEGAGILQEQINGKSDASTVANLDSRVIGLASNLETLEGAVEENINGLQQQINGKASQEDLNGLSGTVDDHAETLGTHNENIAAQGQALEELQTKVNNLEQGTLTVTYDSTNESMTIA